MVNVTVNVLNPPLNRVPRSKHLHIRCLRSTVPVLAVLYSPLPMAAYARWPLISFEASQRVCALLTMCCMGTALM